MTPFFSIIIPVYNVAPYLRECLDSIRKQTFTDWESICVDDGSSDGSGAILDEYTAKDVRFKIIHQTNTGVSAARNVALRVASGKYVTFIDGDDAVANGWLAMAFKILNGVDIDLLRMECQYWEDGMPLPELKEHKFAIKEFLSPKEVLSWGWKTYLHEGWAWLSFLKRVGTPLEHGYGFPSEIRIREDNIFSLGALRWMHKAVSCSYPGYFYRQRRGSAISKMYTKKDERLFRRSLKNLWEAAKEGLASTNDYKELKALYNMHIKKHIAPESRYAPMHIFRAIKRRIFS